MYGDNNCNKLLKEVGKAVSKSMQARVGMIQVQR